MFLLTLQIYLKMANSPRMCSIIKSETHIDIKSAEVIQVDDA